jgi:dTDP-4-amino-4,6-dideoxygalactose transaminase
MSKRRTSKFPAFPASDCKQHQERTHRALQRVMRGGQFILGHEVRCFEEEFAAYAALDHLIETLATFFSHVPSRV